MQSSSQSNSVTRQDIRQADGLSVVTLGPRQHCDQIDISTWAVLS